MSKAAIAPDEWRVVRASTDPVSRPSALAMLVDRCALDAAGRGILFAPATALTPQAVNMMVRHGRGLVSAALSAERAFALGLPAMAGTDPSRGRPRFIASVEAIGCTETGISAAERATTLRALADPAATTADFLCPGHIQPLVVQGDDVPGAALPDLAYRYAFRRGGCLAVAWCDILDDDGDVAGTADCLRLARELGLQTFELLGGEVVASADLMASRSRPRLVVTSDGLELGQFA